MLSTAGVNASSGPLLFSQQLQAAAKTVGMLQGRSGHPWPPLGCALWAAPTPSDGSLITSVQPQPATLGTGHAFWRHRHRQNGWPSPRPGQATLGHPRGAHFGAGGAHFGAAPKPSGGSLISVRRQPATLGTGNTLWRHGHPQNGWPQAVLGHPCSGHPWPGHQPRLINVSRVRVFQKLYPIMSRVAGCLRTLIRLPP